MNSPAIALDTGDFPLIRYSPAGLYEWIKDYQYTNGVTLVQAKQAWNNMHYTAREAIIRAARLEQERKNGRI